MERHWLHPAAAAAAAAARRTTSLPLLEAMFEMWRSLCSIASSGYFATDCSSADWSHTKFHFLFSESDLA